MLMENVQEKRDDAQKPERGERMRYERVDVKGYLKKCITLPRGWFYSVIVKYLVLLGELIVNSRQ